MAWRQRSLQQAHDALGGRFDYLLNVRDRLGRAYNRTTLFDQRREMLQSWADYLDGPRDNGPAK